MIGARLGHIQILEKIGEGGMGAVYRSYDEHLRRDVAVKVLAPDALSDESARKRFRKEALALSKLNHPNIEIVYDFNVQDGIDYLVMEYIPGHTLKGKLAGGPMPEREILRLGTQIADGLAGAHERGIVHCDLKPTNIMVAPDGRPKILDFGLAKQYRAMSREEETESMEPASGGGTLPYMAPEQLLGEPPDARTDIYAFGNILYEMTTGQLPFQGALSTALVNEIVNAPPPRPGRLRSGLSPRLEEIVLKCLEKDPENRYQSAKELVVDLRRLSTSVPSARDAGIPAKRKWPNRRADFWLAVFLCVALAGVFVFRNRAGDKPVPQYNSIPVTRTAAWEGHPVFSPDGNQIAYTGSDESGNTDVYLTDVRGNTLLRLTDDAASDSHPSWFPEGDAIAFTSDRTGEKAIWKVGRMGGGAKLLVPAAQQGSVSPDGNRIAFCRESPSGNLRIWVVSLYVPSAPMPLTGDDDGVWSHSDPAWSPDGRTICYGTRHGLWTVPASGGKAQRLTMDGEYDFEPVWSADSRYIYFASKRGGSLAVWRVRAKGGTPQRITTGTALEGHPDISRDRRRLCYSTGETSYRTFLLDRRTGREIQLSALASDTMGALSADNNKIVFTSDRGAFNFNLWIVPLSNGIPSSQPLRLTDPPGIASHPSFSPDGHWIVFYRILKETRTIWVVPVQGGQPIQFTDGPSLDIHPAWSPDGTRIAYSAEEKGIGQLRIASVRDGRRVGQPKTITHSEVSVSSPVWSPDGRAIAFCGTKNQRADVWIVPSDGSSPARPITRGLGVRFVRWDRTSGDILASAQEGNGRLVLYKVSPEDGSVQPMRPFLEFGGADADGLFDVSADGQFLLSSRINRNSGHIWELEATKETF